VSKVPTLRDGCAHVVNLFQSALFWKSVDKQLQQHGGDEISLGKLELEAQDPGRFGYENLAFLRAIGTVSGKRIFVDSSKTLSRLRQYLSCNDIDVKIIHLLRHPLGVTLPRKLKFADIRVLRAWSNYHAGLRQLLSEQQKTVTLMTLRYEDFAEDPEKWVREITCRLGLPFEASQIEYYKMCHHIASGNDRLRLSLHEQQPISLNMNWVRKVSLRQRVYLWSTTSRLLSNYGYNVPLFKGRDWVLPWGELDTNVFVDS